jgi:hypothetical protein
VKSWYSTMRRVFRRDNAPAPRDAPRKICNHAGAWPSTERAKPTISISITLPSPIRLCPCSLASKGKRRATRILFASHRAAASITDLCPAPRAPRGGIARPGNPLRHRRRAEGRLSRRPRGDRTSRSGNTHRSQVGSGLTEQVSRSAAGRKPGCQQTGRTRDPKALLRPLWARPNARGGTRGGSSWRPADRP